LDRNRHCDLHRRHARSKTDRQPKQAFVAKQVGRDPEDDVLLVFVFFYTHVR